MLVFRIVHIVSGIFWVGSAFFVSVFLEPTIEAVGPARGPGGVLTVGAVCAIIAFFVGSGGIPPTINKMNALGKQMAESGGPPAPEQMAG